MTSKKVTALTAVSTLDDNDLLYVVDDVDSTPVSKKMTVSNSRVLMQKIVRTAKEITAGITPTDFTYDPGNVLRYNAKLDNSTDDKTAFQNAIDTKHGVYVPYTSTGARINSGLTLADGVSFVVERPDMVLNYHGSAGTYLFTATGTTINGGLVMVNMNISPGVNGVNGFKFIECRGIWMPNTMIDGSSGGNKFAIGMLLDDSAASNPQVGTAWNVFGDIRSRYCSDAHVRLDTQGTLIWNNRNICHRHYAEGGGTGLDIVRGDTNDWNINPQNCTTGVALGVDADHNTIRGYEESCTTSMSLNSGSFRNVIFGLWKTSTLSGTGNTTTWMTDDRFQVPDFTDGIISLNPASGNAFFQTRTGQDASIIGRVSDSSNAAQTLWTMVGNVATPWFRIDKDIELDGALNHDGSTAGFYGTTPVSQQTGVAVSSAGIHAALVNLGLITA